MRSKELKTIKSNSTGKKYVALVMVLALLLNIVLAPAVFAETTDESATELTEMTVAATETTSETTQATTQATSASTAKAVKATAAATKAATAATTEAEEAKDTDVKETGEKQWEVKFKVDGAIYKTEKVDDGTLVDMPKDPTSKNSKAPFLAWYAEGEDKAFQPTRLITEDLTLNAVFSTDLMVTFLDTDGSVLDVQRVKKGGKATATDKTPEIETGKALKGWALKDSPSVEYNFVNTTVTKNITLVPLVKDYAIAVFITDGGTEINPQTGTDGFTATCPSDPERAGYTFAGWYTQPKGGQEFNFDTAITGTVLIYAHWENAETKYLLNIWAEKKDTTAGDPQNPANRQDYDLIYTKHKEGTTGEKIRFNSTEANDEYLTGGSNVQHVLDYCDFQYSEEKELSSNGDTVINVFYTRTVFKINFVTDYKYAAGNTQGAALKNGVIKLPNGAEKRGTYTIQLKLDENINAIWPESFEAEGSEVFTNWGGYFGNGAKSYGQQSIAYAFKEGIGKSFAYPDGRPTQREITVYPKMELANYTCQRFYYTEVTEEEYNKNADDPKYTTWKSNHRVYGGLRYYKLAETGVVEKQKSWSPQGWPGRSIEGFEAIGAKDKGALCQTTDFQNWEPVAGKSNNYIINYYMPRMSYKLTLAMNGGTIDNADGYAAVNGNLEKTLQYEDAVTLPEASDVNRTNYTFQGWCLDENLMIPYEEGMTMPASALTLYAKYKGTGVTVNYSDRGQVIKSNSYGRNEAITAHDLAGTSAANWKVGQSVEGKGIFQGWYYDMNTNDDTVKAPVGFPLGMQLTKSEYNLYAKWTPETYKVTFMEADNSTVLTVQNVKSGNKDTLALSGYKPIKLAAADGTEFVGWSTEESATTSNFNTATHVVKDITVYPVFKEVEDIDSDSDPGKYEGGGSGKETSEPEDIDNSSETTKFDGRGSENTDTSTESTKYDANATQTGDDSNMALYAGLAALAALVIAGIAISDMRRRVNK